MFTKDDFLICVDAYRKADGGVTDKTLSSRIFDDGKTISNLRGNSDLTLRRFNSAMTWLVHNWPEGVDMPDVMKRFCLGAFALGGSVEPDQAA